MPIQIQGNAGVVADVDGTTYRALRVTCRPVEYGAMGYYQVAMRSGTMTQLAANGDMFQFRYPARQFAVVYSVWISAGPSTAAGAATLCAFRLIVVRPFSVKGSGGTRLVPSGDDQKMRTSMATSGVNDIGIATTKDLTQGTGTTDSQDLGGVAFGIGTGAVSVAASNYWVPPTPLFESSDVGEHPLVLTASGNLGISLGGEGFIIRSGANAMPTGSWTFAVTCAWAEVVAY